MKKLLAIALLLCTVCSLSGFAPGARSNQSSIIKKGILSGLPVSGTTTGTPGAGKPLGTIEYRINGSGTVPLSVSFWTTTAPITQIGVTYFFSTGSAPYTPTGMQSQTPITAVVFHVGASYPDGYFVEFIPAF